jgi:hypothetical protein
MTPARRGWRPGARGRSRPRPAFTVCRGAGNDHRGGQAAGGDRGREPVRGRAGRALTDWWPEQRCTAEYGEIVRPDGYGTWASGDRVAGFFLEYDNGTETTARAAGKLAQYADLATAEDTGVLVLYWLPSPAREAALRPALERAHAHAGAVTVATATPAHGQPAGPVWLTLHGTHRVSLASLPPATIWERR